MDENIDKLHYQLATNTLKTIIKILGLCVGNEPWVQGRSTIEDCWEWYEEQIFNESTLYEALGKEDARTVLAIWQDFKEICKLIRKYKNWEAK